MIVSSSRSSSVSESSMAPSIGSEAGNRGGSARLLLGPSSSMVTSSPVTVLMTSGPVTNIWLVWSTITTKSVSAGE
ncbi:Uncharacterised protein [Mycobacteroides abscessus subsp. abscessus]|nr:Uncharacterised protein [Mycobacteroides abscessus subsp. abscessus]